MAIATKIIRKRCIHIVIGKFALFRPPFVQLLVEYPIRVRGVKDRFRYVILNPLES